MCTDRGGLAAVLFAALLAALFAIGCGDPGAPPSPLSFPMPAMGRESAGGPPGFTFADATRDAGIDFLHVNGAFGEKYLPETMGSGVVAFDYDGDGWTDLYFVNSCEWPGRETGVRPTGRLFRNCGDGTFTDVTAAAGLDFTLYGMGGVAGDVDGDGDADLFLTAYGPDRLLVNDGGRFVDRTAAAGVTGGTWEDEAGGVHSEWSSGAAFLDADGDGDLDLFVANYVRWSPATDVFTTIDGRRKAYTTPNVYPGLRPRLYLNRGDGTFADVSDRVRLAANSDPKALGVLVTDFDRDGDPDLFVTNDTQPNQLLENRGDGTFTDVALAAGVAFDETGSARAGMGVGETVLEGGQVALTVGNFSREAVSFFTRFESGIFIDRAAPFGLSAPTLRRLTFGLAYADLDLDGYEDLVLANGHIEPTISEVQAEIEYREPPQALLSCEGRRFRDVSGLLGDAFARPLVARGLAVLDFDRDGDPDLAFTTNAGRAVLFRNDNGTGNAWVRLRLVAPGRNRSAVGAHVRLRAGGREQERTVRAGGSYLSQDETALTFGLGSAGTILSVIVTWPGGGEDRFEGLPVRKELILHRGGEVEEVAR